MTLQELLERSLDEPEGAIYAEKVDGHWRADSPAALLEEEWGDEPARERGGFAYFLDVFLLAELADCLRMQGQAPRGRSLAEAAIQLARTGEFPASHVQGEPADALPRAC